MSELSPPVDAEDSLAEARPGAAAVPPIRPTDGERLMRFRRYRDEVAFREVVETHAAMVWGVCQQVLRHRQDVEDAFQATFFILARKAKSIRAAESAAGWLYRVAFRTALLVRSQRRRRAAQPLVEEPLSSADQFASIERSEQVLALLEELHALPPQYRQPLVLCYLEGKSRSVAAEELGVTLQSVKGRLARGTRLLRTRLVSRGAALSATMALLATEVASAQTATALPELTASTVALGALFANRALAAQHFLSQTATGAAHAPHILAQKGILAMTIAAAAKPATGLLAVCMTAGMLTIASADGPSKVALRAGTGESVAVIAAAAPTAGEEEVAITVTSVDAAPGSPPVAVNEDVEVSVASGSAPAIELGSGSSDALPPSAGSTTISAGNSSAGNAALSLATPPPDVPQPIAPPIPAGAPTAPVAVTLPAAQPAVIEPAPTATYTAEDVLITAPAPLPTPVVEPYPANNVMLYQAQAPAPFIRSRPMAAEAGANRESLGLEIEYWTLKAAGLQKKGEALRVKAGTLSATGTASQVQILEMEAERDLTLAEVKLCEANAARLKAALSTLDDQQPMPKPEPKVIETRIRAIGGADNPEPKWENPAPPPVAAAPALAAPPALAVAPAIMAPPAAPAPAIMPVPAGIPPAPAVSARIAIPVPGLPPQPEAKPPVPITDEFDDTKWKEPPTRDVLIRKGDAPVIKKLDIVIHRLQEDNERLQRRIEELESREKKEDDSDVPRKN